MFMPVNVKYAEEGLKPENLELTRERVQTLKRILKKAYENGQRDWYTKGLEDEIEATEKYYVERTRTPPNPPAPKQTKVVANNWDTVPPNPAASAAASPAASAAASSAAAVEPPVRTSGPGSASAAAVEEPAPKRRWPTPKACSEGFIGQWASIKKDLMAFRICPAADFRGTVLERSTSVMSRFF
jgi:hypothetical protein